MTSARIEEYRERVGKQPADTLARYVLAKEYFDLGQHGQAIEHFRILVGQKADWMKCWIHLGQSLQAVGDRSGAKSALEAALGLARAQHHSGPAAEIEAMLVALG